MKFIYDHIKELLATVPAVKWTDLDKGQLDNYKVRPAVPFPCALVRININRTDNIGAGVQKCFATVLIRLGFEVMGDTDSHVPVQALADSLQYFETSEEVFQAVHYKKNLKHSPFLRNALEQEVRDDGIVVMNIPFETIFTVTPD